MAIPRKHSRPIVVDGQKYRWIVKRKSDYNFEPQKGMVFTVQEEDGAGALLIVELARPQLDYWLHHQQSAPITPNEIASWIRQAIAQGWQPKAKGKPFRLKESSAAS